MTKKEYLERKGYKYYDGVFYRYFNKIKKCSCTIYLYDKIYLVTSPLIYSQEDINNLQLAFNEVKQDFEECMKLGDKK